jgi:hypothetical protein
VESEKVSELSYGDVIHSQQFFRRFLEYQSIETQLIVEMPFRNLVITILICLHFFCQLFLFWEKIVLFILENWILLRF